VAGGTGSSKGARAGLTQARTPFQMLGKMLYRIRN
jgi:hypothetical protein